MQRERVVRVVIADDHLIFRQGLKALLAQKAGVVVVGETDRVAELPALLARVACDQLLLDLQMERNSLSDIEALAKRVPVVVLTASEAPADALAAIRLGARGVVLKRFAVETLMDAIHTVAQGDVWMPPNLQTRLAARLQSPIADQLSIREEQVVRFVALGLRNAEVAEKLSISERTVKAHLNTIFRKLGIRDRVELTLYAARAGIISLKERSA
jgi:two-component system NarL family response regulator